MQRPGCSLLLGSVSLPSLPKALQPLRYHLPQTRVAREFDTSDPTVQAKVFLVPFKLRPYHMLPIEAAIQYKRPCECPPNAYNASLL